MDAKNYFDEEYGLKHIDMIVSMQDLDSLYGIIEEYAEAYHESQVNNIALDNVMVCEHETTKVKALHGRFYSVCIKCGEVIN